MDKIKKLPKRQIQITVNFNAEIPLFVDYEQIFIDIINLKENIKIIDPHDFSRNNFTTPVQDSEIFDYETVSVVKI
jgi:hypothetical protein